MKLVLTLIVVLLIPFPALAHPGKTDYRGGHKCWKNCGEWGLRRSEYHLHDKDWNPVHLDHEGNALEAEQSKVVPTPEKRFLLGEPTKEVSGPAAGVRENNISAQPALVEKNHTLRIYEESVLPFQSILLLLLAFLMLVLLVFVRKKREKE